MQFTTLYADDLASYIGPLSLLKEIDQPRLLEINRDRDCLDNGWFMLLILSTSNYTSIYS